MIFFRKVDKMGALYKQLSIDLKAINRVFLLDYCSKEDRAYVNSLFPEVNGLNIHMPLKHKIVWEFSRRRLSRLLNLYLSVSRCVKQKFYI